MRPDDHELFELAPAAYVVFDRNGTILAANAAFLELVGRPRGDVVGSRSLSDLLSVGGRIYYETHLMPNLALNGHVEEVALDVVTADGSRAPILLSANVERSVRGEIELVRAVLFEARERRRYEADLLRTTRAAEKAERRATELSRTLQQTLIPPGPPTIPRLDVNAAYRPAGDGREVGGDFYDVFNIAERTWFVVLGDVAGKGIPAATVTAYIRHTVRDLAMQTVEPADVLDALDRALKLSDTDRFCTIVALRLEETPLGWAVRGSVGGHPLPLLGRTDGSVTELGTPGSLVGILEEACFVPFVHTLADDEFIVLYTDGVTEAKQGGRQFGQDRLVEIVGAAAADPSTVTESVVQTAVDFQAGNASDDIAVLTIHPIGGSVAERASSGDLVVDERHA